MVGVLLVQSRVESMVVLTKRLVHLVLAFLHPTPSLSLHHVLQQSSFCCTLTLAMASHNHQTKSTPWNFNLSYAIDWSIALGVPVVFLTVRNLVLLTTRAIASRRQRGYHNVVAVERGAGDSDNEEEEEEDGEHLQQNRAQVDIPTRYTLRLSKQCTTDELASMAPLLNVLHLSQPL